MTPNPNLDRAYGAARTRPTINITRTQFGSVRRASRCCRKGDGICTDDDAHDFCPVHRVTYSIGKKVATVL